MLDNWNWFWAELFQQADAIFTCSKSSGRAVAAQTLFLFSVSCFLA